MKSVKPVSGGVTVSQSVQGSMEPQQEAHLHRIMEEFWRRCDVKYRDGQKRHGGDLHTQPVTWLLEQAIDEAIDQVVYLLTMRERLG